MEDTDPDKSIIFLSPRPSPEPKTAGKPIQRRSVHIALIDPRKLVRESFSELLTTSSRDFRVHAFTSIEQFLQNTLSLDDRSRHKPNQRRSDDVQGELDLIVVSIDALAADAGKALQGMTELQENARGVPIIALADQEDTGRIAEAFRHGVSGYIPTSLTPSVAIAAIRLIIAGGRYVPESVMRDVLEGQAPHMAEQVNSNLNPKVLDNLTKRQLEVLQLLRQGKSNKFIAYEMDVHESTVKVHVREIMKKLNATNRTHAAFIAEQILPS